MNSLGKAVILGLASLAVVSAGVVSPALAAPTRPAFDAARLDATAAGYVQYRRYRGGYGRGAAIAGAVGLGILGAAAIASSRRAYAEPYYDDGYDAQPVYAAPRAYYAPQLYDEAPAYYAPAPRGYYRGGYDFRDHR